MLDLDRITNPLRLAQGSHQPGSGKGCAMNVISYINGDTKITDYPECSARPLSRIVQILNDKLAGPDGFLSPENSVLVLDLGWQTVGTSGVSKKVQLRWLADLLVDDVYGVIQYARSDRREPIDRIAHMLVQAADGVEITFDEWMVVRKVASAAYAYAYAYAYAAYASAAAAAAADAYAYASAAAAPLGRRIAFTQWAITRWRELAGLDNLGEIQPTDVDSALEQINA